MGHAPPRDQANPGKQYRGSIRPCRQSHWVLHAISERHRKFYFPRRLRPMGLDRFDSPNCNGEAIDIIEEGEGRYWNVFEINGENGNILEINQIVEDEPLY